MIRKFCEVFVVKFFLINLRVWYKIFGIGIVNIFTPLMPNPFVKEILRKFGAQIGKASTLNNVYVANAITNDYSNLKIGNNSYIGNNAFFDLMAPIIIEDSCAIAAEVMFITHSGVGERPLKKYYPEKRGSIRVGHGSWIGARATILPGVSIGECAVIGAGAVVTCDIPAYSVAVGVPAKVVKNLLKCQKQA